MPVIAMFFGILVKMNWKDTGQHRHRIFTHSMVITKPSLG